MKKAIVDLSFLKRLLNSVNWEGKHELYKVLDDIVQNAENPCLDMADLLAKMEGPIAFFDTETTGTKAASDRIVSLDIMKLWPNGEIQKEKWLINPGVPIPAGASDVHGITDDLVEGCPTFEEVAEEVADFLEGCDLAHFNGDNFDIPLLAEEMERAGLEFSMVGRLSFDCSNIFRKKEERTLSAALAFYVGESHDDAHNSEADVEATFKIFLAQLKRYPDLYGLSLAELAAETCFNPNKVDLAGKLIRNEEGDVLFNFGKHKDQKVIDCQSYASWMLGADFPSDTKKHLVNVLEKLKVF